MNRQFADYSATLSRVTRPSSSQRSRPSAATSRSALPGTFARTRTYLESDDWVVTWAVGHLVELVAPEEYDTKFKKWRMADLPIVPEKFKLRPRDAKSEKQLEADPQADRPATTSTGVVNACDAGREGELIFAYIYETAKIKKPVQRLWLQLDDQEGDPGGVRAAAPGRGDAPRSRRPHAHAPRPTGSSA